MVGAAEPGPPVGLLVTDADGNPVEGAMVTVHSEEAGTTDAQGRLSLILPDGTYEVEITARLGEAEDEIELELKLEDETAEAEEATDD